MKEFTVGKKDDGLRVDRFLMNRMPEHSKMFLLKAIKTKKIRVRSILQMKKKIYALLASFMLAVSMLLTACGNADAIAGNIASQVREEVSQKKQQMEAADSVPDETGSVDLSQIPEFSGKPYVVINGNKPFFKTDELTAQSFESYGNLDNLGR